MNKQDLGLTEEHPKNSELIVLIGVFGFEGSTQAEMASGWVPLRDFASVAIQHVHNPRYYQNSHYSQ